MKQIRHDEPYLRSLATVARQVLVAPFDGEQVLAAWKGFVAIVDFFFCLSVRLLSVLLYPISVPLLTLIARADSRISVKQEDQARERMLANRWGLTRKVEKR